MKIECFQHALLKTIKEWKGETLETPRGPVYIRKLPSKKFLERLEMDEELGAFDGYRPSSSELEKEALLQVTCMKGGKVIIAHTGRKIVGFLAITPPYPGERWGLGEIEGILELEAIEVSRNWRGLGIASRLLEAALADAELDDKILFVTGYTWNWDLDGTGLTKEEYHRKLITLFEGHGFTTHLTDEPNICSDPANVLLVRIGPRAPADLRGRFMAKLFQEVVPSSPSP